MGEAAVELVNKGPAGGVRRAGGQDNDVEGVLSVMIAWLEVNFK